MAEKKNIPEIRFKGFNSEWEDREFSTIVTRVSSISGKVGLPSVEYEDIISCRGELNKNINQKECSKIGIEFDKGDVLYGKLRPYLKNWLLPNFKGVAVGDFWVLRANDTDSKFVYYLIQTPTYETVANQSTGTKMPRADWNLVSKTGFNIPTINIEQSQIGTYFQHLDKLITLHQAKYNKLVSIKKAMLEKMFPKNDADVPEIRLRGFSGAWVKRKLGDLLDITSASRVHKNEWTESGVPFFRSSDVVADYKGTENNKAFISFELYEELSKKAGCVQKNDLLVTGGGSIGIPYLVKTNKPLYFKDADLLWLKKTNNINGYFLYTFFSTLAFRRYVNRITHIGTISHYTIEQAKSTPIIVPEKAEQDKIGEYLLKIDNLITLHQRELEKLKNIKKACLEKMFV